MCIHRFVMILVVLCLLAPATVGGCSEEQLQRIDRVAADVNQAGQLVSDVTRSPAATLLPPEVRSIMELFVLGVTAALAVWQRIRASGLLSMLQDHKLTGAAIVAAIEKLPPKPQAEAKAAIKNEMQERECFRTANAVVDELKKA